MEVCSKLKVLASRRLVSGAGEGLLHRLATRKLQGLELLIAEPADTVPGRPPLLCVHGGFHSALFWQPLLEAAGASGWRAYALSIRHHGKSDGRAADGEQGQNWGAPRAVCFSDWLADIGSAVEAVAKECGGVRPILLGHSAGGGAVQAFASRAPALSLSGLLLLCAFPPSGSWRVFRNWLCLPYVGRALLDTPFQGSRALLSTPERFMLSMLAKSTAAHWQGSPEGQEALRLAHARLEVVESALVPIELATTAFASVERVLAASGGSVAVLGADEDVLMTPAIVAETARAYGVESKLVTGVGHAALSDVSSARVVETVLSTCCEMSNQSLRTATN